ncbi:MAG: ferredoxin [Caulobacteraceae bacterium]|nr:ferredoxin [Caulobacteraceae bacterium]
MKIIADHKLCSGHARCSAVAPEVFELDADGYVGFTKKEVPQALAAQATRGVRACPERALKVVEET